MSKETEHVTRDMNDVPPFHDDCQCVVDANERISVRGPCVDGDCDCRALDGAVAASIPRTVEDIARAFVEWRRAGKSLPARFYLNDRGVRGRALFHLLGGHVHLSFVPDGGKISVGGDLASDQMLTGDTVQATVAVALASMAGLSAPKG